MENCAYLRKNPGYAPDFLCESELRSAKEIIVCPKASFSPNLRVQVKLFEPWFASSTEQVCK